MWCLNRFHRGLLKLCLHHRTIVCLTEGVAQSTISGAQTRIEPVSCWWKRSVCEHNKNCHKARVDTGCGSKKNTKTNGKPVVQKGKKKQNKKLLLHNTSYNIWIQYINFLFVWLVLGWFDGGVALLMLKGLSLMFSVLKLLRNQTTMSEPKALAKVLNILLSASEASLLCFCFCHPERCQIDMEAT